MTDSYKETESTSWGSRIVGSLKGMVVGTVMFLIAFPLLFWNEGNSVRQEKSLDEGANAVVSASAAAPSPGNEGKLVHLSGFADTDDVLVDPAFGVQANAIHLKRHVEMFQWHEKAEKKTTSETGGSTKTVTEYKYTTAWSEKPIDSSQFRVTQGHENPAEMPYSSETWSSQNVSLGGFRLEQPLRDMIDNANPLFLTVDMVTLDAAKLSNGSIYFGEDPRRPQIGDLRISYRVVPPQTISVVARQTADTLAAFPTKAGSPILLLERGTHTAEAMFAKARSDNATMTWMIRGGGFLLMYIGLLLIFKPLHVVADVLPIAGAVVNAGTSLIALLLSMALGAATVAIAWIFHRPLFGAAMIAASIIAAYAVVTRAKRTRKPSAPSPA